MTPGEPDAVAAYLIVMSSKRRAANCAAAECDLLLVELPPRACNGRTHRFEGNCAGVVHRDAEAATVW
jgi:hypothetical protein